ncbi:serine hydrolase domain-containing protein [Streptomyces marincola]|uniref:serine hydrolase domain-containing protein n=1 Tax=Streptomyces marincola TaxID=2878388 RepID=UPI00131E5DDB|nr:serine hydrolase domain-containing protein [Streptomyces marincola]
MTGAVAAVGVLAVAGCGQAVGSQGGEPPDRVERAADALVEFGVSGVQVRVSQEASSRVVTSGVADLASGEPVAGNGYLRAGSVTKTFVATAVLQLAAEGVLSLDDPVGEWLPGTARGEGVDLGEVTVRHLLQHTSGLQDHDDPELGSEAYFHEHRWDVGDPGETVAAALGNPALFAPGEGWAYSNAGYVLVGMVIEEATGQHWAKQVHDRIIRPLGLTDTFWPGNSPFLPSPHATGYQVFEPGGEMVDVTDFVLNDTSGSLISTAADLDVFLRALLGGALLGPEELADMQETVPLEGDAYEQVWPNGAEYGLGLFRIGFESCEGGYWHSGGDIEGAMTRTGITDDGTGVVAFASTQVRDSMESLIAQNHRMNDVVEAALCD